MGTGGPQGREVMTMTFEQVRYGRHGDGKPADSKPKPDKPDKPHEPKHGS